MAQQFFSVIDRTSLLAKIVEKYFLRVDGGGWFLQSVRVMTPQEVVLKKIPLNHLYMNGSNVYEKCQPIYDFLSHLVLCL